MTSMKSSKHQPNIMCLQETHLKPTQTNFLTQYTVFRKDRDSCTHSGGVAIAMQKSDPCQFLQLLTPFEAVAVQAIIFNRLLTVCCLYIPTDYYLSSSDFESLIGELPPPFLLVGDLNAHCELRGSERTDTLGRVLEKFL